MASTHLKRAVFFDRDGTLCKEAHYLSRWEDFEPFDGLGELGRLREAGFLLIGVSNQSGIARGIIDEGFVKEVNDFFIKNSYLDAFYYCPHHPDDQCSCRKPAPGMALNAAQDFGIDLKCSYVVGDKEADMLLARAVGARAIFVTTGEGVSYEAADHTATSLSGAVNWILEDRAREGPCR